MADANHASGPRQAAGACDRKKEARIIPPPAANRSVHLWTVYVNNRSLKKGPEGSMCCRAGWNERAALMTAGGVAISGSNAALDAQKPVGGAVALISTERHRGSSVERLGANSKMASRPSIGFLFTDAALKAAGRLHLLALHLPLGAANQESR
jgi:hypothetical protein